MPPLCTGHFWISTATRVEGIQSADWHRNKTHNERAPFQRNALYGRERPVFANHFSFRCHFCFSERSWMAFDVAHYDGMLRAWGRVGRGDCDMAGLHPSKGCRGQTFSCPWPRTPGGAGLMSARSKRLAPPGQKPAPSWKMWIEGLLCLGPRAMRSEKTDLCWELDCVWTLSLSQPVGRHTDWVDNCEVEGVTKKKTKQKKAEKGASPPPSSSLWPEKEAFPQRFKMEFFPLSNLNCEIDRKLNMTNLESSAVAWKEGLRKHLPLYCSNEACDVGYYSPSRLFWIALYIYFSRGKCIAYQKVSVSQKRSGQKLLIIN